MHQNDQFVVDLPRWRVIVGTLALACDVNGPPRVAHGQPQWARTGGVDTRGTTHFEENRS